MEWRVKPSRYVLINCSRSVLHHEPHRIFKKEGSQNTTIILAILLVLIVGGGIYYILQNPADVPEADFPDPTDQGTNTPGETHNIPDFEITLTGEEATQRLSMLKGRTQLTPNILGRIAFCLSLKERGIPNENKDS